MNKVQPKPPSMTQTAYKQKSHGRHWQTSIYRWHILYEQNITKAYKNRQMPHGKAKSPYCSLILVALILPVARPNVVRTLWQAPERSSDARYEVGKNVKRYARNYLVHTNRSSCFCSSVHCFPWAWYSWPFGFHPGQMNSIILYSIRIIGDGSMRMHVIQLKNDMKCI